MIFVQTISRTSPTASSHAAPRRGPIISRRIEAAAAPGAAARAALGCANLAHGFAACAPGDKASLRAGDGANLGIVTAYNDMLSAHQPYERFPDLIRAAAREAGGVGAGGGRRAGDVRRRDPGRGRAWSCRCSRAT